MLILLPDAARRGLPVIDLGILGLIVIFPTCLKPVKLYNSMQTIARTNYYIE